MSEILFRAGQHLRAISNPAVMGIINLTPDSFYASSRMSRIDQVLARVELMLQEGADIVDFGAVSTRPGSVAPEISEEIDRLLAVLLAVRAEFPELVLSLDTYRAEVLQACIEARIDIVNDIGAGRFGSGLLELVASYNLCYILMHASDLPVRMQENTTNPDVISTLLSFFDQKLRHLRSMGISDVWIDPGFGFGKTLEQNFTLLQNLDIFQLLGHPVLLGFSRKSMIYKTLNITPDLALNGTTALHMAALERGASVLRVHDVKEAKEAVVLWNMLEKSRKNHSET